MSILSGRKITLKDIKDIKRIMNCLGGVILLDMDAQANVQANADEREAARQEKENVQWHRDVTIVVETLVSNMVAAAE